jgi:serine/threonine-protein kinase RsbW
MDLSPGSDISPVSLFAGRTIIGAILARQPVVCLDTKPMKPLTYKLFNVSKTIELSLPSRIESVDESASFAEKVARDWGYPDDFISSIDLAVRESVANAVKHGNKFDEEKHVLIEFADTSAGFEMSVRDFGSGFDVDAIPDPTDPAHILSASGRGILFMRSFMDTVEWQTNDDGGTTVKMVKRR